MWQEWKKDLEGFRDWLIAVWGRLFRFLFISSIGIYSYSQIDDYDIGNIPLAQLTLKQIFGRFFWIAALIGCVIWFFKFPMQMDKDDADLYLVWGRGGIFLIGLGACLAAIAYVLWFRN